MGHPAMPAQWRTCSLSTASITMFRIHRWREGQRHLVSYARSPGIHHVVLLGWSGGGSMVAYYQNVAEKGVAVCQAPERLDPCSSSLAGLPRADGVVFLDAIPGLAFSFMSGSTGFSERRFLRDERRNPRGSPIEHPDRLPGGCFIDSHQRNDEASKTWATWTSSPARAAGCPYPNRKLEMERWPINLAGAVDAVSGFSGGHFDASVG